MIVECDQCRAKYHYDEARFGGKPSKKLRCSKCRSIFEIFNTHAYEAQPPLRPPIADGTTMTRRSAHMFPEAALRPEPARERRRSAGPLKLPMDSKLSLAVIAGPDAGRMFAIETPRVVIGREEVDLALDDPEISRHHAAIEVRGEDILLLDLGSTNGTFVGEQAISQAPLENQSEFTVGGSTLMLIVTAA
ncbi:MAG TPA: FHA domain-containing protein [Thermoanaerobaculia bacterium]